MDSKDRRIEELEIENARLERLVRQDCVSGLLNRRAFESTLKRAFEKHALARQRPLGVVMFDIDHFKIVNDTYGHRTGDAVLHTIAQCIKQNVRRKDALVARYGGEEFVTIATEANPEGLRILAERVRRAVEELEIPCFRGRITLSAGYAVQHEDDTSGWDAVNRADKALYRAKNAGRNRVEG